MRVCLLLISIAAALAAVPARGEDSLFPRREGEKVRYAVMIERDEAYISGIAIIACQEEEVRGAVFNEFGVSVVSFSYNPRKRRVKILDAAGKLNRWYVRRTLRKDLVHVMSALQMSETTYVNERRRIRYTFTPLDVQNETAE